MQMATVIGKRQAAQPGSALAEMALLNAILTSLPDSDPLHAKIGALFAEADREGNESWNLHYEAVLVEARRKIM